MAGIYLTISFFFFVFSLSCAAVIMETVPIFLLLASTIVTGTADPSNTLRFSLMVSDAPGLDTTSVEILVDKALKEINNSSDILPGYSLSRGDPVQLLRTEVINRSLRQQKYHSLSIYDFLTVS